MHPTHLPSPNPALTVAAGDRWSYHSNNLVPRVLSDVLSSRGTYAGSATDTATEVNSVLQPVWYAMCVLWNRMEYGMIFDKELWL